MRRVRIPRSLAVLLLAYLLTGAVYSVTKPAFEAPDESFHFWVIKHIIEQHALPVQKQEMQGLWEQEGSQPPLYYLCGALFVSWVDLSDAEDLLWHNPQANIGDPTNPGNKNVYIHPTNGSLPWHGTVLAVHLLRFFSLALGAVTVALAWSIVRLLFPAQPVLPLLVATVMAFIPQFLFITSSINNDNAITCLGALALYLLLRLLKSQVRAGVHATENWLPWVGVGLVLGLAALSKLSGLALLGLVGIVIALVAWHRRSWRVLLQASLAVGVPVLVIAGWWYVRNAILYGDPTGLSAMWEIVGQRNDFGQDLQGEWRGLRYSFWGVFGWFSILLPNWVYRIVDTLSVLALVGLVLEVGRWAYLGLWRGAWSAWRYREPEWGAAYRPLSFSLLILWLMMVALSLLRWTSLTHGSQGRLLYPALVPTMLLFVLGLRAWFIHGTRDAASAVLAMCMFAWASVTPRLWIAPHYAHPSRIASLPAGAVVLDIPFGDAIVLRGVRFEQEVVHPGDTLQVDLYWETTRSLAGEGDFMVWLRMVEERPDPQDIAGGVVGLEDSYPGAGTFPTSLWPTGQLLADRQYIRVGVDARAPLVARLDIALYDVTSGKRLSSLQTPSTIGRVKVVPRRWPPLGAKKSIARFECGISLAAYDIEASAQPGQTLPVTLTWSVEAPPQRDYTVFVHLEDEWGKVWGYGDGPPRQGNYPTWVWAAQEMIVDEHRVVVAHDTPAGRYHVKVGFYDPRQRMAAYGTDGTRLVADAVDLGTVEIR